MWIIIVNKYHDLFQEVKMTGASICESLLEIALEREGLKCFTKFWNKPNADTERP